MSDWRETLAQRIRQAPGSYREKAERSGLNISVLHRASQGKEIHAGSLVAIIRWLGIDAGELFGLGTWSPAEIRIQGADLTRRLDEARKILDRAGILLTQRKP